METIEERAHNQAQEWTDPAISWAVEQELVRFGKEQKKIDIDKACEWLKSHTNDKWVYNGKEYEGPMVTAFRKFMEQ